MKKSDVVSYIFQHAPHPASNLLTTLAVFPKEGIAFAPTNIALAKYWGKRDSELNLPMTSSLSVSLPGKGATTHLTLREKNQDLIILNGEELASDSLFVKRTVDYLDLFRPEKNWYLNIRIDTNIPIAAGLASSACGFASLVLALNELFAWKMARRELSILARLGSGSAARSLWDGFVEWHAGVMPDGSDSYGEPLQHDWPGFCVGILIFSEDKKILSSREAMQRTMNSSVLYENWPRKVAADMAIIKQAMKVHNFSLLAGTAESNALSMHATMLSSWPPICYFLPETIAAMQLVWQLRKEGLQLYFTEDAGPNLKLLFLEKDSAIIIKEFPQVEIVKIF